MYSRNLTYLLYPMIKQKIHNVLPVIAGVWVVIALIFLSLYGREAQSGSTYVDKAEKVIWVAPQGIIDPRCIQLY